MPVVEGGLCFRRSAGESRCSYSPNCAVVARSERQRLLRGGVPALQWIRDWCCGKKICPGSVSCDTFHIMHAQKHATTTEMQRKAIADSGRPMLAIANETGIQRASLIRFARGDQSLRLDIADRLASYFGLKLVRQRRCGDRR